MRTKRPCLVCRDLLLRGPPPVSSAMTWAWAVRWTWIRTASLGKGSASAKVCQAYAQAACSRMARPMLMRVPSPGPLRRGPGVSHRLGDRVARPGHQEAADGGLLQMTLFDQQDLSDRPPGPPRRAACRLPHSPGSSPRSRGIGDLPPGGLLGARGDRCRGPGGIAGQRGYEPGTVQDVSLGSGGPHCRASASYYET
jgi:hypothetical protein